MDSQNRLGQRWLVEGHQKAVARTLQKIHDAGYCKILTAVSGFCIQQDAAGVDLVGIQVQAAYDFVGGDEWGEVWVVGGAFGQPSEGLLPLLLRQHRHR